MCGRLNWGGGGIKVCIWRFGIALTQVWKHGLNVLDEGNKYFLQS